MLRAIPHGQVGQVGASHLAVDLDGLEDPRLGQTDAARGAEPCAWSAPSDQRCRTDAVGPAPADQCRGVSAGVSARSDKRGPDGGGRVSGSRRRARAPTPRTAAASGRAPAARRRSPARQAASAPRRGRPSRDRRSAPAAARAGCVGTPPRPAAPRAPARRTDSGPAPSTAKASFRSVSSSSARMAMPAMSRSCTIVVVASGNAVRTTRSSRIDRQRSAFVAK